MIKGSNYWDCFSRLTLRSVASYQLLLFKLAALMKIPLSNFVMNSELPYVVGEWIFSGTTQFESLI